MVKIFRRDSVPNPPYLENILEVEFPEGVILEINHDMGGPQGFNEMQIAHILKDSGNPFRTDMPNYLWDQDNYAIYKDLQPKNLRRRTGFTYLGLAAITAGSAIGLNSYFGAASKAISSSLPFLAKIVSSLSHIGIAISTVSVSKGISALSEKNQEEKMALKKTVAAFYRRRMAIIDRNPKEITKSTKILLEYVIQQKIARNPKAFESNEDFADMKAEIELDLKSEEEEFRAEYGVAVRQDSESQKSPSLPKYLIQEKMLERMVSRSKERIKKERKQALADKMQRRSKLEPDPDSGHER